MRITDLIETPSSIIYYIYWATKQDILVQYISTTFKCINKVEISRTEFKQIKWTSKNIEYWDVSDFPL